jgi:hypothetical protein
MADVLPSKSHGLEWKNFSEKYLDSVFDPYTLTASATPQSYELSRTYGGDVARLNRKLKKG